MTNAIRLAAVTAFAMTFAAGCGGKTACDEFADYIEECGVTSDGTATGEGTEIDCSDGTEAACVAECGLAIDCSYWTDPMNADPDVATDYLDCITGCAGGGGTTTGGTTTM